MIYQSLEKLTKEDIENILEHGTREDILKLPLSVGMYHESWKEAQDICLLLMKHDEAAIRANAVLGLAYIARTKGKLDKRLVKPYLLKELRENKEFQWRIIDSIKDINLFLGWNLAKKSLQKINDENSK